jgi:hypothetical protein
MRTIYFIPLLFFLVSINSFAQETEYNIISGRVQNKNNEPVEFATLYNHTQKTSCITNNNGKFILHGEKGDSIRLQHLNYKTNEYVIHKPVENFVLLKKDFFIDEVIVSPKFAFDLFKKSCENTYKTFKAENISRAYVKCVIKLGKIEAQVVDLDLDIVQKKMKSYKRGEQIHTYKIQERIESLGKLPQIDFMLQLNFFYPTIQQIYWVDLPDQFNYIKKENSNSIQLILTSKSTCSHKCNIEITIDKKDSTLLLLAIVKKDVLMQYWKNVLVVNEPQLI